jgi:hypothetical protein
VTLIHASFELVFTEEDLPKYRDLFARVDDKGLIPLSELPKIIGPNVMNSMSRAGVKIAADHPTFIGVYPDNIGTWVLRVRADAEKPE